MFPVKMCRRFCDRPLPDTLSLCPSIFFVVTSPKLSEVQGVCIKPQRGRFDGFVNRIVKSNMGPEGNLRQTNDGATYTSGAEAPILVDVTIQLFPTSRVF